MAIPVCFEQQNDELGPGDNPGVQPLPIHRCMMDVGDSAVASSSNICLGI